MNILQHTGVQVTKNRDSIHLNITIESDVLLETTSVAVK